MAEGKKSVLIYSDIIHTVEQLDNETAGQLFKHFLRYINDLNPETENVLVKIAFEPIKQNLKRDLSKWESKRLEKSNNGRMGNLKRYNIDLYELVTEKKIGIVEAENIAKSRKTSHSDNLISGATIPLANVAVNDNDNDNVNVNVNVNVNDNDNVNVNVNDIDKCINEIENTEHRDLIKQWVDYKKTVHKQKYKTTKFIDLYRDQIITFGYESVKDAIQLAISSEYKGYFPKAIHRDGKQKIFEHVALKVHNPIDLISDRVKEIYTIQELEEMGHEKCRLIFNYITKDTEDRYMNESEKWYKILYL